MNHRRQFITAGMATLATLGVSMIPSLGTHPHYWLRHLEGQLAGVTAWLRMEAAIAGTLQVHCGVRDLSGLAAVAGGLAGPGSRVLADGNEVRFTLQGTPVCLVLHFLL